MACLYFPLLSRTLRQCRCRWTRLSNQQRHKNKTIHLTLKNNLFLCLQMFCSLVYSADNYCSLKMFRSKRIHTFTLIEMLIVIVVIWVLAAALIPKLMDVQLRARDAKRKIDLTAINAALVVYREDNQWMYPYPTNIYGIWNYSWWYYMRIPNFNWNEWYNIIFSAWSFDSWAVGYAWIAWLSGYITTMPVDPTNKFSSYNLYLAYSSNTINYMWPWMTWNYVYQYGWLWKNRKTFMLSTALENPRDPGRCVALSGQWYYSGALLNCFDGFSNNNNTYTISDIGP